MKLSNCCGAPPQGELDSGGVGRCSRCHEGAIFEPENVYAVEVIADETGKWYGNNAEYATRELAQEAGQDLFSRWMLVREFRVVERPHRDGATIYDHLPNRG